MSTRAVVEEWFRRYNDETPEFYGGTAFVEL